MTWSQDRRLRRLESNRTQTDKPGALVAPPPVPGCAAGLRSSTSADPVELARAERNSNVITAAKPKFAPQLLRFQWRTSGSKRH